MREREDEDMAQHFDRSVKKRISVDRIIEEAWKRLKGDYEKEYKKWVESIISRGKYGRYFDQPIKDETVQNTCRLIFPYYSEDDVVRNLSRFIWEVADEWGYKVVVHGQIHEKVWKKKRKYFYPKSLRPDLTVLLLKKSEKGVKVGRFERAGIEVKYLGSYTGEPYPDYLGVEGDIKKIDRLVRRKEYGLDRGYVLVLDESCGGKHIPTLAEGKRGEKRIGADIFCPPYARSFNILWELLDEEKDKRKIKVMLNAICAKIPIFQSYTNKKCYDDSDDIYAWRRTKPKYQNKIYYVQIHVCKDERGVRGNAEIELGTSRGVREFRNFRVKNWYLYEKLEDFDYVAERFKKAFRRWNRPSGRATPIVSIKWE